MGLRRWGWIWAGAGSSGGEVGCLWDGSGAMPDSGVSADACDRIVGVGDDWIQGWMGQAVQERAD